jgi:hypothetical protein
MYSAVDEAAIIVYMAAFSEFNSSIQKRLVDVIKRKGTPFTGTLYRGQPFQNHMLQSKYPFFSASKHFYKAVEFTGEQNEKNPGNVFVMHCKNVKVLDLTRVIFSESAKVKSECRRMLPGFPNENFEYWWKSRDWLDFQTSEGEVLVWNKLHFKKPKSYSCSTQSHRKWCRANKFQTLTSNVTN